MINIYTRDWGRSRRREESYTPPPGYVGTAFSDGGMKMHEADTDISELARDRLPREEFLQEKPISEESECSIFESEDEQHEVIDQTEEISRRDGRKLEALIKSLRGKFGTEELILILILLIVSSDGIGIETLVLGLLLMVK
ncbi:MAG: hypothetical protein J6L71_01365 [Clostridia bacterium]|nr:hypothetical protein [Clostridia bacterium]MBQ5832413.1 hypothetical protein [Selenomonadales bacterium]